MIFRNAARTRASVPLLTALLIATATTRAGGVAEHALLIVDPTDPASLYLANHYRTARQVPDSNFLYIFPTTGDYAGFVDGQIAATFAQIDRQQIGDHIDYIILAPTEEFFVDVGVAGLITDSCSPVTRFSLTGAYSMALIASEVQGGLNVLAENEYYRATLGPRAFSSSTAWLNGQPSTAGAARRYYLGAQLGQTGVRGNTVGELIAMIDRSAAVDGTFPAGTFYYCETTDTARSGPRDSDYPARVADIIADGGSAAHLMDNLPGGTSDGLGVMTGLANPPFSTAGMTLVAGAFGDHLTSYAGTFDNGAQTKMSEWINVGASGSWGTVEEPCNYSQKFPNPRIHVLYNRGLPLGDACFRAIRALPFQGMLYGDPLTRPFTHIPAVSVGGLPGGTISGTIVLTPSATTTDGTATIAEHRLLVDGVVVDTIADGATFTLDTTTLADGWHDLRVLTTDDRLQAATGRWRDALLVDNTGRGVTASALPTSGDHATTFDFTVGTTGAGFSEIRLMHNGRIVAAAAGSSGTLSVTGLALGAGLVEVYAEGLLSDGTIVRSAPQTLNISFTSGTPSGNPPLASSYTRYIDVTGTTLVELPGGHDNDAESISYVVTGSPSQATISGGTLFNYRLVTPDVGASGTDTLTFRIDSPSGSSTTETVTLIYSGCLGDVNGDDLIDLSDLAVVLGNFGLTGGTLADGDTDGDGDVDLSDLATVLSAFGSACP